MGPITLALLVLFLILASKGMTIGWAIAMVVFIIALAILLPRYARFITRSK